jgi:hypothetical protein
MQPEPRAAQTAKNSERTQRLFTVDSANRALVLVRRIVQDVVAYYPRLRDLRTEREELNLSRNTGERRARVQREIEGIAERLRDLKEELADIGCELKDWVEGLVDFPALHENRKVWLCWKLGDSEITHWHEWEAGFSGRQPIGPGFGASAPANVANRKA